MEQPRPRILERETFLAACARDGLQLSDTEFSAIFPVAKWLHEGMTDLLACYPELPDPE